MLSSPSYILQRITCMNTMELSQYYINDEEQVDYFFDYIDWDVLLRRITLSDDFLIKNMHRLNWEKILANQQVSMDIIKLTIPMFNDNRAFWSTISEYQQLDDEFMQTYFDLLPMHSICRLRQLSEDFLQKNLNKLDIAIVCGFQKLTEEFILRNANVLYMELIFGYQILSEAFIERYCTDAYWPIVARNQQFSFDFMNRHANELMPFKNQKMINIAKHRQCINQLCSIFNSEVRAIIESMIPQEQECQFVCYYDEEDMDDIIDNASIFGYDDEDMETDDIMSFEDLSIK